MSHRRCSDVPSGDRHIPANLPEGPGPCGRAPGRRQARPGDNARGTPTMTRTGTPGAATEPEQTPISPHGPNAARHSGKNDPRTLAHASQSVAPPARHSETKNRDGPVSSDRDPGRIRGILPVVPPQTGEYAADVYRPEVMRWEQCTGNNAPDTRPFPVEPGRAARRRHNAAW